MRAAYGKADPPPSLQLKWICSEYDALPDTGAALDQDAGLMTEMTALSNIYGAVARMKSLRGHQIHNLTSGERRIIKMLVDMGLMFNG